MESFGVDEDVFVFDVAVGDAGGFHFLDCFDDLLEDEKSGFFGKSAVLADELVEVSDFVDFLHYENEGRFSLEKVDWLDDGLGGFSGFELEVDFRRDLSAIYRDVFGDTSFWDLLDDDGFASRQVVAGVDDSVGGFDDFFFDRKAFCESLSVGCNDLGVVESDFFVGGVAGFDRVLRHF